MADKAWKAMERRVARFFGTVRNALSGGNSKITRSDSLHPKLYVECKYTSGNQAVISLWDDTLPKAQAENKTPVIVLGKKGRSGFWVACHSSHLIEVAEAHRDALEKEIDES